LNGKLVRSNAFHAGHASVQSWTTDLTGLPKGAYVIGIDVDGSAFHRSTFLYGN